MHKRLKLKGAALLSGNVGIMILTLTTALVLILSANLFVPVYEIGMKTRVAELYGSRGAYVNLAASLLIISFCYGVYRFIKLGTDRFFLRRAQKKGGSARDIFYYFHPVRAADAMLFSLRISLLRFLMLLVAFLPSLLSVILLSVLLSRNVSVIVAAGLFCGCGAFAVSGAVFYKNITLSLFLCEYYYIDGSFVSFRSLVASGQKDMKKQFRTLRRLRNSFAGWFMLCVFILPVGYVWSYYKQTMALAAAAFMDN